MSSYRALTDHELDLEARLLQRKVEALRLASTALAVRLLERYMVRLDQVRAEMERRKA
jgi:hypothetical protein